jgi:hypothetical protein
MRRVATNNGLALGSETFEWTSAWLVARFTNSRGSTQHDWDLSDRSVKGTTVVGWSHANRSNRTMGCGGRTCSPDGRHGFLVRVGCSGPRRHCAQIHVRDEHNGHRLDSDDIAATQRHTDPALPPQTTGSAWQVRLAYPTFPHPDAIACPSSSTCYVAGGNSSAGGDIFGTTDTGGTWRTNILPTGVGTVTGISCPSPSICYATDGSDVLETHNGGTSWTIHGPFADTSLAAISCPSITTCYAVGGAVSPNQNPLVLGTADAGAIWTQQSVPSSLALYRTGLRPFGAFNDVACPSTNVCFALGSGDYMVTRDAGRSWADDEGLVNGADIRHGGGDGPFGDSITCPSTTMCVNEWDNRHSPWWDSVGHPSHHRFGAHLGQGASPRPDRRVRCFLSIDDGLFCPRRRRRDQSNRVL